MRERDALPYEKILLIGNAIFGGAKLSNDENIMAGIHFQK